MSRRVSNLHEAPPGYWRYEIPELPSPQNKVGPCNSLMDLKVLIWQRYQANSVLPPQDLDQKIHDYMCARLPAELCGEVQARVSPTMGMRAADVLRGTRTLVEWTVKRIAGQAERVSLDEASSRAAVCIGCVENKPVGGCAPCVAGSFFSYITRLSGGQKTEYDSKLGGCNVCGCSLKGKVWIPLDVLLKNYKKEQLDRFPQNCWMLAGKVV